MKAYEGLFLVDDGKATDNFGAVADHVRGLLQRHGAAIEKLEKWDSRRLAYEVKGHKRGTYILTRFKAPPSAITGLQRDCEISNVVLRAMVLLEEHVGQVLEGYDELDMRPRTPRPAPERVEPSAEPAVPGEEEVPGEPGAGDTNEA